MIELVRGLVTEGLMGAHRIVVLCYGRGGVSVAARRPAMKNSGMSFPEPNICILTLTTIMPSLVASQDNRNWGEP